MKTRITIYRGLFLMVLLFGATVLVYAQDAATREITSLDFEKQRPKPAAVKTSVSKNVTPKQRQNIALITNVKRKYSLVKRIQPKPNSAARVNLTPNNPARPIVKSEQIGVTFWRLRPIAKDEGEVPVFPVRTGDGRENWTAERVNSTTRFNTGDRMRFTIESSRSGYLYIINRELYTDGTGGTANIIFPTLRTRSGDNHVMAGSLVDIPSAADSVPYFTIKPNRKDYAGEELIVLITKEKLPLEINLKPLQINVAQLEKWSNDWGAIIDIYDAEDGEGIAMTNSELTIAQALSRALEQEEPLPQTIYKVQISGDLPLFVPFRMTATP